MSKVQVVLNTLMLALLSLLLSVSVIFIVCGGHLSYFAALASAVVPFVCGFYFCIPGKIIRSTT